MNATTDLVVPYITAREGEEADSLVGHPQIGWFLASQLVRELREYEVVNLDDPVPAA